LREGLKWTDEDGEYHEAYFENVNQLANTLRAFKDLGEYFGLCAKEKETCRQKAFEKINEVGGQDTLH